MISCLEAEQRVIKIEKVPTYFYMLKTTNRYSELIQALFTLFKLIIVYKDRYVPPNFNKTKMWKKLWHPNRFKYKRFLPKSLAIRKYQI